MLQELISVVLMVQAINGHLDCGIYVAANGKSCLKCQPGYYKISDCDGDGKPAGCMPCQSERYQSTCTEATTCAKCSSHCKWSHSYISKNCTSTSDIICECLPGFYFIDQGEGNGICNGHRQCPPGQGVSKPGTAAVDVKCEPCVPGDTYSNISSSIEPCQKCHTCLPGTSVKSSCTPYNNTECSTGADHKGGPDGLNEKDKLIIILVCVITAVAALVGLLICIYKSKQRRRLESIRNLCCRPAREIEFENGEQKDLQLVEPPVTIQDVAPRVIQVDPPEAGQVAQHVTNDIRRTDVNEEPITEDQLDNESSTKGDTVEDAGPISESDVDLHKMHLRLSSEKQETLYYSNSSVCDNAELKQIAHNPRNFQQHEQSGAAGQDILSVTPNSVDNMDQHKGPTEHSTLAIPTEAPITEDHLDNERSTDGDTVEDAGPINESDEDLHKMHLRLSSEMQETLYHNKSSVYDNTELKQIVHNPRNFQQHEQSGAAGQDIISETPSNLDNMDQHKGPTEHNTLAIPTDTTVEDIALFLARNLIKDFKIFIRYLYRSTVPQYGRSMPDVDALIDQVHIDYKDNVVEANYQLQKRWAGWYGRADENFCITICSALRQCDANKILAELEERFRPYFPTNGDDHSTVRGEIQFIFSI